MQVFEKSGEQITLDEFMDLACRQPEEDSQRPTTVVPVIVSDGATACDFKVQEEIAPVETIEESKADDASS